MPTPAYITDIRRSYGSGLLLLPGVAGVVVDGEHGSERILLVRRSDSGRWSVPAGILEPDEQPADSIVREIAEETCVRVRVERLVLLTVEPEMAYPNGDRCQFVSMTFRCAYLDGVARVGDEECSEVDWFALDELPPLQERELRRIRCATAAAGFSQFDQQPDPTISARPGGLVS